MRKLLVLPMILLLSVACSAIVLEITFGLGVVHNATSIEGFAGAPIMDQKYYFTDVGVSTTAGDAFVVSDATETGIVVFNEIEQAGDCSWTAYIADTAVALADLDGYAISAGNEIKWAVAPNNAAVTICKLDFDLNVVI